MDFDQAINAHVQWKSKLAGYIAKPDKSLNALTVSGDRNCELGKWLHGEGTKYSSLRDYAALVADHARFHRAAGEVIKKADSGQDESEEVALGANSEFSNASMAVVSKLMQLKREVK